MTQRPGLANTRQLTRPRQYMPAAVWRPGLAAWSGSSILAPATTPTFYTDRLRGYDSALLPNPEEALAAFAADTVPLAPGLGGTLLARPTKA